jgi:GNAT superfamily N-acetyltransferase
MRDTMLGNGFWDVPSGKLAAVVTFLEMRHPPAARPDPSGGAFSLRPVSRPDVGWYRELYSRVGSDWLWFSRLRMPPDDLREIIHHPDVLVFALAAEERDEGLLELDFRTSPSCELAFFGVTRAVLGKGAGRFLMNRAIEEAWRRPIDRFWVHTCTLDHPDAPSFYIRSGFRPYKRQIEIDDDPRLTGVLSPHAAPHIPLIRP